MLQDLLHSIALPRVEGATRGKAWPLAMQYLSSVFPDPPSRVEWRTDRLSPRQNGRDSFCTVPLLVEAASVLATEPAGRAGAKVKAIVEDAVKKHGVYDVLACLAECCAAQKDCFFHVVQGDGNETEVSVFFAHAVALLACYLAICMDEDALPVIWRSGLYALRVPVGAIEEDDTLLAAHYTGVAQHLLELSSDWREWPKEMDSPPENGPFHGRLFVDSCPLPLYPALAAFSAQMPSVIRSNNEARALSCKAVSAGYAIHARLVAAGHAVMPECPPSYEGRGEIVEHAKYALWPGLTDVEWRENGLEGMILAPGAPGGEIHATLLCSVPGSALGARTAESVPMQLYLDVPKWGDAQAWEDARQNASEPDPALGIAYDELAAPVEAIRMCVVPRERKTADRRRIPGGYVHSPKKPSGDVISVLYVPRVARGRQERVPYVPGDDSVLSSGGTRAAHQVAAHVRQIPAEWHASEVAREAAENAGMRLPESGFTFVKAHIRGEMIDEVPHRTVRVKKRRDEE